MRRSLANFLLLSGSILFCLVVAELVVRLLDDLPLFAVPLPLPIGSEAAIKRFDEVPLAAGVQRDWFFRTPPPLPNRTQTPEQWQRWYDDVERAAAEHGNPFRGMDMLKAWNAALVGDPCANPFFASAPGRLFVYDPADGKPFPPYRFLADTTGPDSLVTNDYGWRGPPVPFARSPRTVRIVFVGASAVVMSHHMPYSFPEFVGYWLNIWAAARGLDVRFEVMNAARESNISTDIEAIVRQEVVPLRPDLVIYYEGANQFRLNSLVPDLPADRPPQAADVPPGRLALWMLEAQRYSALARRLVAATGLLGRPANASVSEVADGLASGDEWPKPPYTLVWPAGLDERDPDLARPELPVQLSVILRDLDRIRADLAPAGGELALASYQWLVHDGMKLDPVRHRFTLGQLNGVYYPFRYRDLERLAKFQNVVLAKYAATHHLPFIDVAGAMPEDPDLYVDAVHTTYAGGRIRGWVVFNQLVPLVEQRLATGVWPRPVADAAGPDAKGPHPAFRTPPRVMTFKCGR